MICNFFQKNLQKNLVVSKKVCTFALANQKSLLHLQVARLKGEMVEWSITAVLKTAVLRGTGGSNPSLSAISPDYQVVAKSTPNFTPKKCKIGCF